MKKILCLLIILAFLFAGCSETKINTVDKQRIKDFAVFKESETVKISNADYNKFVSYLNYDNIECPYNELFGIEDALKEKQMNYGDKSLVANAEFDWIESDKREYLLHRNNVLYDAYQKPIVSIAKR